MISSLARALLFMHIACGCAAFYLSKPGISIGKFNTARLNRQSCPELMTILSETQAFSEGLRHATTILADVSASIPAVEQIPYEPGEISNFPQIVAGSAACVLAYAWAAYEFGKVSHLKDHIANGDVTMAVRRAKYPNQKHMWLYPSNPCLVDYLPFLLNRHFKMATPSLKTLDKIIGCVV